MAHFNYLPQDVQDELRATANAIVSPGKGILAADESTGTLFEAVIWFKYQTVGNIFRNYG